MTKHRTSDEARWAKNIKELANLKCQVCGYQATEENFNRALQVHHLNSYASNSDSRADPSNGVCLCWRCHSKFHKRYGRKNNTQNQFEEFLENATKSSEKA